MSKVNLPIANGFYQSESLPISAQRCVGWYPNLPQTQALSQETLLPEPGIEQQATTGTTQQANRGARKFNGNGYFVNGTKLYRLNVASNTITELGDIPSTGRVSMSDNGTQICILIPGGNGYIFTEGPDTLTQITDGDFTANGNPLAVAFVDGYFVFTTDEKKFIISALNDGLSYNALDFGSAESDPDEVVAPIVLRNQLYIVGKTTTEAFQNVGGSGFPFRRTGLFLSKGCDSQFSLIISNDAFMFVGGGVNESPAIWVSSGNQPQKISTTAIDSVLNDLTQSELSNIYAWSYAQKGAYFVGFQLPDTCFIFDTITQRWHERQSRDDLGAGNEVFAYRVSDVIEVDGRVLVGDNIDGRIGELKTDVYGQYGNDVEREIVTQPFQSMGNAIHVKQIELTMEAGVGDLTVTNPQVKMERSVDGGKTWKAGRLRPIGKIGEYLKRTIWRRCGRAARFECFRFRCTDQIKAVVIQCVADVEQGAR